MKPMGGRTALAGKEDFAICAPPEFRLARLQFCSDEVELNGPNVNEVK
jgi:hypothetical protein